MTSGRESRAVPRGTRFAPVALAATLLAGCAALPDDAPVVEQMDEQTGLTIARLGHPLELYREVFRQDRNERFGFLGPFETNKMGQREVFLWVALPVDAEVAPDAPTVTVDGARLDLGEPGRAPEFAGLRASPYKIPTPWIVAYYFRIDAATVARLGAAHAISVDLLEETRNVKVNAQFLAQLADDPRLREFASAH